MVLVGQQAEVQRLLVGELLDRLDGIGRDAEDDGAGGLVVGAVVADPAGLRRAAGRVGLGIEVEDDGLPRKSESETSSPSWSGSVKSGAVVPSSIMHLRMPRPSGTTSSPNWSNQCSCPIASTPGLRAEILSGALAARRRRAVRAAPVGAARGEPPRRARGAQAAAGVGPGPDQPRRRDARARLAPRRRPGPAARARRPGRRAAGARAGARGARAARLRRRRRRAPLRRARERRAARRDRRPRGGARGGRRRRRRATPSTSGSGSSSSTAPATSPTGSRSTRSSPASTCWCSTRARVRAELDDPAAIRALAARDRGAASRRARARSPPSCWSARSHDRGPLLRDPVLRPAAGRRGAHLPPPAERRPRRLRAARHAHEPRDGPRQRRRSTSSGSSPSSPSTRRSTSSRRCGSTRATGGSGCCCSSPTTSPTTVPPRQPREPRVLGQPRRPPLLPALQPLDGAAPDLGADDLPAVLAAAAAARVPAVDGAAGAELEPDLPVRPAHRARREAAAAARGGAQHALAPPRPPRRQRAVPGPQLRRHPGHLGPAVRQLRARGRARALRADEEHRDVQPRQGRVPRVRRAGARRARRRAPGARARNVLLRGPGYKPPG